MAIVKPVVYPSNILEAAIITMTPDGAVAGKGVERLVDRDIGLECEDAGIAGQRTWHADLGIAPGSANAWLFSGSGYAGKLVTLESSTDDLIWTFRASVTPAADVPTKVDLAGTITARFWRWYLVAPSTPVRFTEVTLSIGVTLKFKPTYAALREGVVPQVATVQSATGRSWGIKRGARRWSHTYVMTYAPDVDRTAVLALFDAIEDGAKPCWLLTVTGEIRWVRISAEVDFQAADQGIASWDIPLHPVEELP